MAKRIAPHFIEELKERVDIVDVVNSRVPLKKTGANFQACCPFHHEKTPSFFVSPTKQIYRCFGCGAKGRALNFVMEFDNLGFVDAVEKLSEENGITVEYEQLSQATVEKIERQKTLYDYLDETAKLYEANLYHQSVGVQVREYLAERQLDKETVDYFRLGYSQAGNHLQNHFGSCVEPQELQKAGLLGQGDNQRFYDFFRDRLMFPIRDARGRVVGFGARALGDAKPKYLNTGDTELFNKSSTLYGLYEELQTNRNIEHLIVVEGYMDVIALHQMGVQGAVAALGTAFTQGHLNLVRKYTKKIFICFDGDNAGKKAAKRAMELILPAMTMDTKIKMVFLPDGEDPDTLVRKVGAKAFNALLEAGDYLSQFVCEIIIGDSKSEYPEERGEMTARAKLLLDDMTDIVYRDAISQELFKETGFNIYKPDEGGVPHVEKNYFTSPKQGVNFSSKFIFKGGLESRLIRQLIASPELACYVRHEGLLKGGSTDRELLLRVIQYFQFNPIISNESESLQRLQFVLNQASAERLAEIVRTETLPMIDNESFEQQKQRLHRECLASLNKLLNEIQEKLARRG